MSLSWAGLLLHRCTCPSTLGLGPAGPELPLGPGAHSDPVFTRPESALWSDGSPPPPVTEQEGQTLQTRAVAKGTGGTSF